MTVRQHIIILAVNIVGFGTALVLILFGIYATFAIGTPEVLKEAADWLGMLVTLFGVIIVASSSWFPINKREPDPASKNFLAPAVILVYVAFILLTFVTGTTLSSHIVNGFAITGLTGSIMRLLPFSEWESK